MNPKRILITMVALIACFQSVSAPVVLALEPLAVQAYATDTVAGYPSALRTSLISPNQDVRFVVEKPDGTVAQIPAQADLEGVAKADFFGHQTKQAGKYRVAVVYPGSAQSSPQSSFVVYPDQVSTTQSTLKSTMQMAAAGVETTFLVTTLYDQYRNPIANHSVKLISSRSEDNIINLQNGVTDQNGRANFKVSSPNPGVSVFTAMDSTVNQVLAIREEVVFFQPTLVSKPSLLGSLFRADIGGDGEPLAGPVDHFDIEGLPAQAKLGQELSPTIVAKDQAGIVAKGYTGTILISSPDDENATLPGNGEYTFKDTDQGKFTFNLSLAFTNLGKQTIQVLDKSNFKIAGEKSVDVIPKEGIAPGPASSTLVIKSPADGAQLGTSTVILSGQGLENINLKVFMDDAKISDNTQTDSDGFFTFEAKDLESASHTFYVMSDNGEVSKPVAVTIDTVAPVANSFDIFPEGNSLPGESLSITVSSEPKLEASKVRVQGAEFELKESASEAGKYEATVIAPDADGTYGVDLILVDSLGNKAELLNKGTVVVQKPAAVNPPKVEGLEATPGDGLIQLKWTPATPLDKPIQKYRISYGTSLSLLDKISDTQGAVATWELRDLANDTQYFVSIKAVDSAGMESLEPSVTIAATPFASIPMPLDDPYANGAVAAGSIQAIPYDGAVSLTWVPFAGIQAYHYKVFIGTAPGRYSDSVTTIDNATSLTISDLINNLPYVFAVAALDLSGNTISPLSQEVQAVPSGLGFHASAPTSLPQDFGYYPGQTSGPVGQAPTGVQSGNLGRVPRTTQTGPEEIWVLLASAMFAFFLYHHKRKVLNPKR